MTNPNEGQDLHALENTHTPTPNDNPNHFHHQTKDLTKEEVVYSMLTECTGKALGDSGDAYGRHWEKNQHKTLQDFRDEPSARYTISPQTEEQKKYLKPNQIELSNLEYTISTFHYLMDDYLQLDDVCRYFNTYHLPAKNWESTESYGLSSAGEEWLKNWGFQFEETFNTTNEPDFLSQTLQGTFLTIATLNFEESKQDSTNLLLYRTGGVSPQHVSIKYRFYVLLQLHQGYDTRAGYTDARLFHLPDSCLPPQHVHGTIDGYEVNNWNDGETLKFETKAPDKIWDNGKIHLYF